MTYCFDLDGTLYNRLIFGKPPADVYFDNKAVQVAEFHLARFGKLSRETVPATFPPFPSERE